MSEKIPAKRQPKRESRLSDVAFDRIKQQIIQCVLKPGSEVTESQLSKRFRLGKAPIRAALMRLSQQGLIRSVRRRGYVIAPITMRDVNSIFQLRLLLEPQAARLAAGNSVDEKQLRRLDQLCGAGYSPNDSGSAATFLRANREFHVSIARSSGNERLANMIDQLLDEMERLFHFGLSLRNRTLEMRHEHEELVDALAQGDSDAAERIAAEQILTAKKMVTDAIMSNSEMMDVNLAAISDGRLRA